MAAQVLDCVLVDDADATIDELPDDYFDTIVCNDVLEHLTYPWVTLERLRPRLRPGGVVVASIPNIRYLPALSRIIFVRDFPLDDGGVFDGTHVRWFTLKGIRRMFEAAGYGVQTMKGIRTAAKPVGPRFGTVSPRALLGWACGCNLSSSLGHAAERAQACEVGSAAGNVHALAGRLHPCLMQDRKSAKNRRRLAAGIYIGYEYTEPTIGG
jgi:SAM-dependent methyltransferase